MIKKVIISCKINNINIECNGDLYNNIVTFKYDDNEYSFDTINDVLTKKNNYVLNFSKKLCSIDSDIDISIDVKNIAKNSNSVNIAYKIGEQDFNLYLKYEMEGKNYES